MKKISKLTLILTLLSTFILAETFYSVSLLQKINKKYGKYTVNRFVLLKKKIKTLKDKTDLEKLKVINDFFNKVQYSSDSKVWKKKDYWATPYEFLIKDKGDSEDYAFAKYFTLVRDLNIDSNKLHFIYVKSTKKKIYYMVLAYYKTKRSIPLILDSINYRVLPANKRVDIKPVYSFNAKTAGLNSKDKFKAKQGLKFRDLIKRIKEGRI